MKVVSINKDWLRYSLLDIPNKKKLIFLNIFKTPVKFFEQVSTEKKYSRALQVLTSRELADVRKKIKLDLSSIIKKLEKLEVELINIKDKAYPELLKKTYDAPVCLYVRGVPIKGFEQPSIAIVGSRKALSYGRETAFKLAYKLSLSGFTIVSGLAVGIDTFAHMGTLKARGTTLAILGSGIDIIYPSQNRRLYNDILKRGAVISEFPPGTPPHHYNFPKRNRIIAGLTLGTVVVEAAKRSGALITSLIALNEGREVFAVPGNISYKNSSGTNNLIKNGAKLVQDYTDIIEEFPYLKTIDHGKKASDMKKDKTLELSSEENKVYKLIVNQEMNIDKLFEMTEYNFGKLSEILLHLELKRLIKRVGNKYIKLKN